MTRKRVAWLLVVPFLVLARPAAALVGLGLALTVAGLALRGWAAGTIRKEEELATTGPYAFLRHPLYLGSLAIGCGLALGGGSWFWPVIFIVAFVSTYAPTIRGEELRLRERFGARHAAYAAEVRGLLPRLTPYRAEDPGSGGGFDGARYARNREWEAFLGAAAAWAVLLAKLAWR